MWGAGPGHTLPLAALAGCTLVLVIAAGLTGCAPEPRGFEAFYGGDASAVTQIVMLDGSTGEMRRIAARRDIDRFFDFLAGLTFVRRENQAPRAGYLYWVDLYEAGGKALRVTFAATGARIDGVYYSLNRDVSQDLHDAYEQASPWGQPME
jgi:hypothetical protein